MAELGSYIKCENCGARIEATRKRRRFCLPECKSAWWTKERKRKEGERQRQIDAITEADKMLARLQEKFAEIRGRMGVQ